MGRWIEQMLYSLWPSLWLYYGLYEFEAVWIHIIWIWRGCDDITKKQASFLIDAELGKIDSDWLFSFRQGLMPLFFFAKGQNDKYSWAYGDRESESPCLTKKEDL